MLQITNKTGRTKHETRNRTLELWANEIRRPSLLLDSLEIAGEPRHVPFRLPRRLLHPLLRLPEDCVTGVHADGHDDVVDVDVDVDHGHVDIVTTMARDADCGSIEPIPKQFSPSKLLRHPSSASSDEDHLPGSPQSRNAYRSSWLPHQLHGPVRHEPLFLEPH